MVSAWQNVTAAKHTPLTHLTRKEGIVVLTTILRRLREPFGSTISVEEKGPNPDFDQQVHAERV